MALPTVSALIATYNRRDRLERALAPLLADASLFEVVVVVDGSRDGSMELLEQLAQQDERVRPLFIENRGHSGALYAGAEIAQGEVLLLLDDDEVAGPGLVAGHAAHHSGPGHKVVVGYAPVVLPGKRTPENFATFVYHRHYESACRDYEADPDSILRRLHGGHISLRREDYLTVGEAWPDLVDGYHEDMDFGLMCLRAGFTGVFDRSLVAVHEYDRPLTSFLADARSSGVNRSMVHWHHSDLLGPLPPDQYEQGLPAIARAVVHSARRPRLQTVWTAALLRAALLFGRLHLFSLQTRSAQLMRRIEHQRGAIEFAESVATGQAASRGRAGVSG